MTIDWFKIDKPLEKVTATETAMALGYEVDQDGIPVFLQKNPDGSWKHPELWLTKEPPIKKPVENKDLTQELTLEQRQVIYRALQKEAEQEKAKARIKKLKETKEPPKELQAWEKRRRK